MNEIKIEGHAWGEMEFVAGYRPQGVIEQGDVPDATLAAWAGGYLLPVQKLDGSTGYVSPCKVQRLDHNGLVRCTFKQA